MRSRLTSSRFVGRVGELAELELAVQEARSGRPTLVLLGGDSGVGKTRLVSELEQRLAGSGEDVVLLRGTSIEQGDGELPYAPLLSALRPLARGRHPALAQLTAGSRAQLATIVPGLDGDDGRGRDDRPDPAGQLRLFEAVLELVDLLSEPAGLVFALEDMHWADRSTLTFVSFLARSLRTERVMLLLTHRTDELHRRHPLRPVLSELERLEGARRIDLDPFDRDELSQALADILGAAPDRPLLNRLFVRSEGNPLYTEELLAAGLDGRGAAPQSLRDAFMVRIERLSPDAQRLARAVAVGRVLDEGMLVDVTGLSREAVQVALREAVAEQVLIACDETGFGFRHALLREALHDDLLPGERSELHLALARAIEQRAASSAVPADDERERERAATVAGHYAAAGDQPEALRTTVVAAVAAQCVYAFGEAADLADRALELWPRVAEPARVAGIDHVELLNRAARAHADAGDRPRAEVLLREALRELGPATDPDRFAFLLGRLSRTIWTLNRGEEAVAMAERALAVLPPEDPAGVRPLLLAWLARVRFLRGRFHGAVSDAEAALEAAIAAGDRLAECELLNTLGMARCALQEVDEGVALLHRAIEIALEEDDWDSFAAASSNLADMLLLAGRGGEAVKTAEATLARMPRFHSRSRFWVRLTLCELTFETGDWAAARAHLERAPEQMVGVILMFRELRAAELAIGIGDEEEGERLLDAAHDLVRASAEPQWIGLYGTLRAELHGRRGELDVARRHVEEELGRIELCTDDAIRIARLSAAAVYVEAERAQRARDLRETAERRDALARARMHMDRLEAAVTAGGPVERARLQQAKAEMAVARGRGSAREWARAAEAWAALERPYPAARAHWREAECEIAGGHRDRAAAAAARALAGARQLGCRWLTAEVESLAGRARLNLRTAARDADGGTDGGAAASAAAGTRGGGNGRDGTASADPGDPFGLTPRERQVLSLLAQGATNRQIGAALYMAEKTASVHVSRILAKLDVQGRTEAAAVAHRLHLV
jgi:DNA-binding CsgD family transcriptional regulator